MDLAALMNDGSEPSKKPSHVSPPSSVTPGGNGLQASPPPLQTNGSRMSAAYAPARAPSQNTPLYASSSASFTPQSQPQSRGLTPLHTPSQASGGGQYPFPQQYPPTQSPAQAHSAPPYRSYEPHSATTPGPRPASHGYSTHPSPGPAPGQYQHAVYAQQSTSISPTPSQHSQPPHPTRQSPSAAMNHASSLQAASQNPQYHPSQPTTPLGPPQVPQRHSNQQIDPSSPYHQRTYSGTSNGVPVASPAHHHPNIGNLVDSPGAYQRPSSSRRQTSEYRSSADRERSLSVSPKTMVPPRPPSLGSRHSSQQDVHSARSSLQPSASVASVAETAGHAQPPTPTYVHPHSASHSASDASQEFSRASAGQSVNGNPLSPSDSKTALQHQTQRMAMNHLLTPTQHAQQHSALQTGSSAQIPSKSSHDDHQSPRTASSTPSQPLTVSGEPQALQGHGVARVGIAHANPSALPGVVEAKSSIPQQGTVMTSSLPRPQSSLKRSADLEPSLEPTAKRGRRRKYLERPLWAQLSRKNPRYGQPGVAPNGTGQSVRTQPQPQPPSQPQPQNRGPRPAPNGGVANSQPQAPQNMPDNVSEAPDKPWLRDQPIDEDLANARTVLGRWEKSLKWGVPIPPITKAIMDWLYQNLEQNSDVGGDPREGSIEIEAKIGTLIDKNTGQRCSLPVENVTVISTRENKRYNFDSQMNETEHQNMNRFLNEAVQRSRADQGREPIMYEHIRETDSFQLLSDAGLKSLPAAAQKRPLQRDLKLRTSVQDKTGLVSARIVKIPLGDHLHIYGANQPYDVRVSMNLEINLDRPGLDPDALTEGAAAADRPPPPNRHKDRLSYRHLAFHVDLTRVDVKGLPPKYELELEVNAATLREQIALAKAQRRNAYMEVVDGFVANTLWLMRQQR